MAQRRPKRGKRFPITYDGLRGVLFTALRRSGITVFHIHDLRHDFESKLLRSSRNLALVQKALGHIDIKSTVRYAHVLDDEIVEAMDAMAVLEFVSESGLAKK
jgi:site-specific recombinase XerD